MTNEQALTCVKGLEKGLKGEFDLEAMNAVWKRLLACDSEAMTCACAVALKQHKRLLPAEALARMVEFQQRRLDQAAEPVLEPLRDDVEKEKETLRLCQDLCGMPGLTPKQHRERLYALADRFNSLDFARQADEIK